MSAGCRSDRIDISILEPDDQTLFTLAAEMESMEVTLNGDIADWTVNYNSELQGRGYSNMTPIACRITLNNVAITATPCDKGGVDQRFIVVSRHEIRHCGGYWGHDSDPTRLMHAVAPCWPVD